MQKLSFSDLLPMAKANMPIVAVQAPSVEDDNTIYRILQEVAIPLKYKAYVWAVGEELKELTLTDTGLSDNPLGIKPEGYTSADQIAAMLDLIEQKDSNPRSLYILQDVHKFLSGSSADELVIRKFKTLYQSLKRQAKRVLLLGQSITLPPDFLGMVHLVETDLPNAKEVEQFLLNIVSATKNRFSVAEQELQVSLDGQGLERLIRACLSLTISEIGDCLRFASQRDRRIDAQTADLVTAFKIEKLSKLGIEFSSPPDVPIGGMGLFKEWIATRVKLFSEEARAARLPLPKGCILLGPSGTGKSLAAKTTAQIWGVPILRIDLGQFMSSLVGESENNLKQFFHLVDSIAPCVVWIDEIEKAFAGAASGPSTDSGVGRRMFGSFLQWMNDRVSSSFVIATANSLNGLPPEFLRKGRFDEIFFVDLPSAPERYEILKIHAKKYKSTEIPKNLRVEIADEVLQEIVSITVNFSGAELGYLVDGARIEAFAEGSKTISLQLLEKVAKTVTPVAVLKAEELTQLRDYCSKYARPASEKVQAKNSRSSIRPGDAQMEF